MGCVQSVRNEFSGIELCIPAAIGFELQQVLINALEIMPSAAETELTGSRESTSW